MEKNDIRWACVDIGGSFVRASNAGQRLGSQASVTDFERVKLWPFRNSATVDAIPGATDEVFVPTMAVVFKQRDMVSEQHEDGWTMEWGFVVQRVMRDNGDQSVAYRHIKHPMAAQSSGLLVKQQRGGEDGYVGRLWVYYYGKLADPSRPDLTSDPAMLKTSLC